jgi:hypothetical protein
MSSIISKQFLERAGATPGSPSNFIRPCKFLTLLTHYFIYDCNLSDVQNINVLYVPNTERPIFLDSRYTSINDGYNFSATGSNLCDMIYHGPRPWWKNQIGPGATYRLPTPVLEDKEVAQDKNSYHLPYKYFSCFHCFIYVFGYSTPNYNLQMRDLTATVTYKSAALSVLITCQLISSYSAIRVPTTLHLYNRCSKHWIYKQVFICVNTTSAVTSALNLLALVPKLWGVPSWIGGLIGFIVTRPHPKPHKRIDKNKFSLTQLKRSVCCKILSNQTSC